MTKRTTQSIFKSSMLLFICLLHFQSFSQTFDWETAVDNGDNATQTVSGVTATVTTNIITSITDNISVLNNNGFGGSVGKSVITPQINNSNSMTVSFSSPIDIASLFAFDADQITGNIWTFTPTGGSNTAVSQAIANDVGSTITLNWTGVTSFTITSAQGNDTFGIDNIAFTVNILNTDDFTMQQERVIKPYPNPASDYIEMQGVTKTENFKIFNSIGVEIVNGIVSDSEKIDIQGLPSGVYYMTVNNEVFHFIKK